MILFLSFIVVSLIGTVAALEPDIDINRIHRLPKENFYSDSASSLRSLPERHQFRTNDYVDYSSGFSGLPTPLQVHVPSWDPKTTSTPLNVHPPKEDPRLFYQSDAYLEKNNRQNINQEVTFIYPGREVNRATEETSSSMSLRVQDRNHNFIDNGFNICVRCPHDRTLVARAGTDLVILQSPRLFLCSGHRAPRNVRFVRMYGPNFGSLIERGSHLIIGRIMYKDKSIYLCKMQVHVITQSCATPKNLISSCNGQNCTFTCRNTDLELKGPSSLQCGSNMKWTGELPYCRARTWCIQPSKLPSAQLEYVTKISCQAPNDYAVGDTAPGYVEGSKCRMHCKKGWRWHPRAVSVCRRGEWTIPLECHRVTKRRTNKFRKS